MAGRISDADREKVRDASRIEQVVGEYVALRNAGGGNLKGLCPFHDEKTPSFQVSPARGFYHCFGCGKGGDVFSFLQEIDHLTFNEAVQALADRAGITLTMVEGGTSTRAERGTRSRLLAANKAAAAYYADQLATAGAQVARDFLAERGFDLAAAAHFGCGYAPDGWDDLVKALTAQGFSVDELYKAGLARPGQRGPIDQFHRRLLWSIRDAAGDVVGFGARRLFDDDRIQAKYLNTSETQLYKKSQVLFGLDLAKRDIMKQRQVVVVEGYTDVMAMHLAGITTAVASCGTAFGDEHITVLRRYLLDTQAGPGGIRAKDGTVVYTFDGDAAGQQAALKAFESDQRFAANTFVAVEPGGMDPCELRQARGDEALRELVGSAKNLFEFAIQQSVERFNLETAEGEYGALNAGIPLVARIKDDILRDRFAKTLALHAGTDIDETRMRVRRAAQTRARTTDGGDRRRSDQRPDPRAARRPEAGPGDHGPEPEPPEPPAESSPESAPPEGGWPDPRDRELKAEREALKLALQQPALVAGGYGMLGPEMFRAPAYARVHQAIEAAGGPRGERTGPPWVDDVRGELPEGRLRSLVTELAVERPEWLTDDVDAHYAGGIIARLAERQAKRQELQLRSALQRAEASGDRDQARALNADLLEFTRYRLALTQRAAAIDQAWAQS
ncbi:DNA primase [Nakamurella sp.]|uniref:DNA primase n=1 Tax=Nakamurella sp. TaxID=1869182 RepID=UPI00378396A9